MCIYLYLFIYCINICVSIQESALNILFNGCQGQSFSVCATGHRQYMQSQLRIWTGKANKISVEPVAQRDDDWYAVPPQS